MPKDDVLPALAALHPTCEGVAAACAEDGVVLLRWQGQGERVQELRRLTTPGLTGPSRVLWSEDGRYLCCLGEDGRRVTLPVVEGEPDADEPIWQIPRSLGAPEPAPDGESAEVVRFPVERLRQAHAGGFLIRIVERLSGALHSCQLDGEEVTLGRLPDNELVLPGMTVSRRHARLLQRAGRIIVVDLASTNGTWLNGRRLDGPEVLDPDDLLVIGDFVVTAELDRAAEELEDGPEV